ncbi:MAG: nitrite reductase (NAD(P)H) small subunit [Candidatus Omnitrophica bacterium]|nr:nitrite reductase (NAD(P)H) small subunit [Candidatus Omnitrophota bacterium]
MSKQGILNLGTINQISIGQARCFVIQGEEIAIFRSRSGELFAIENQCPHRRGPLSEGVFGEGKVICPLHGHKFDLKTGQGHEAQECIKTYKAWEDQGKIQVEFPRVHLTGSSMKEAHHENQ